MRKRLLARVLAEDLRNVVGGCPCEENQETGTVDYSYNEHGEITDVSNYGGDEDE